MSKKLKIADNLSTKMANGGVATTRIDNEVKFDIPESGSVPLIMAVTTEKLNNSNELKQNKNKRKQRIGETSVNKLGNKMKIIEYNNATNIMVKFEDGSVKTCTYFNFKNGEVKSCFDKTICGVGFLGDWNAPYKYINGKQPKVYRTWKNAIERCNKPVKDTEKRAYKLSSLCDEWLNFSLFAKWYDENFYQIDKEEMCLDKDILFKGNKIYSPKTCVFVPQQINKLFTKSDYARGDFPIGVSFHKDLNLYGSSCKNFFSNKSVHLGYYKTPKKAFEAYRRYKEHLIKKVADFYRENIPEILYDAMYKYKVEITD